MGVMGNAKVGKFANVDDPVSCLRASPHQMLFYPYTPLNGFL